MKRERIRRLLIALVVALSARSVHALPTQFVSGMRAATCCAQHCQHSHSLPSAARCCATPQNATDPLSTTAAPPPLDAVLHVVALAPSPAPLPVTTPLASHPVPHERAGPIYLLTCSLQR